MIEGMVVALSDLYKHLLSIVFPDLGQPKGPITQSFLQIIKCSGRAVPVKGVVYAAGAGSKAGDGASGAAVGRRAAAVAARVAAAAHVTGVSVEDFVTRNTTPTPTPAVGSLVSSERTPNSEPAGPSAHILRLARDARITGDRYIRTELEFQEIRDIIQSTPRTILHGHVPWILLTMASLFPSAVLEVLEPHLDRLKPTQWRSLGSSMLDVVAKPWGTLGHYRPQWKQWCGYVMDHNISPVPLEANVLAWLQTYMESHPSASWVCVGFFVDCADIHSFETNPTQRTLDTMAYAMSFLHSSIYGIFFPAIINPRTPLVKEFIKGCREVEKMHARLSVVQPPAVQSAVFMPGFPGVPGMPGMPGGDMGVPQHAGAQ
jgi:hypothetical protein